MNLLKIIVKCKKLFSLNNLYLCSAGTHPSGGITGINGQNAAKKIIEDLR